jgi:hypothetical protein
MNQPAEPCIAVGCDNAAEPGRKLCHGHRKREKQHKPVDAPLRPWGADPYEHLESKAIALADAKDADERAYKLAQKRLKYAATKYANRARRPKVPKGEKATD